MHVTPDAPKILLLPGWLGSGPDHWQSRWERLHGAQRVEQDDWVWPRRGDWMARLDETMLADPAPVVLVAHSLGCHLVAAWAAHSRLTAQVRGALLVAPPDLGREDMPVAVQRWHPSVRERLPFETIAVVSSDDPFAEPLRARGWCADWGARVIEAGARGHLNAESGLGDWPEGWALTAPWRKP